MLKPAASVEIAPFPQLVEDIGENPARFLQDPHNQKVDLAVARIQGIDYQQTLNAWLAVERRLNGGRRVILDAIEERRAYLEEHGEREQLDEDELERRRAQRMPDEPDDEEDVVWRHEKCGSTDVDQESAMAWYCNECEQRTNRVEPAPPQAVAADGGDPDG